jgi:FKBP-type peptidyl-prolyl cis-trans isomerase SlpA
MDDLSTCVAPGGRLTIVSASPATPTVASIVATTATPTVQPGSFLTLHYRLQSIGGSDVVNTFNGTPATLSLGSGELSPGLEAYLLGMAEGARNTFELSPDEAFGPRNPQLLQRVSMAMLREHGGASETWLVGNVVQFPTPDRQGKFTGVLAELSPAGEDWALFDFNHPLAGVPLHFEVQIIGVL